MVLGLQPVGEVEVGAEPAGDVLGDDEVRSARDGLVEGLVDERGVGSGAPLGPGVLARDGEVLAGRPDGDDGAPGDVLVAEVLVHLDAGEAVLQVLAGGPVAVGERQDLCRLVKACGDGSSELASSGAHVNDQCQVRRPSRRAP